MGPAGDTQAHALAQGGSATRPACHASRKGDQPRSCDWCGARDGREAEVGDVRPGTSSTLFGVPPEVRLYVQRVGFPVPWTCPLRLVDPDRSRLWTDPLLPGSLPRKGPPSDLPFRTTLVHSLSRSTIRTFGWAPPNWTGLSRGVWARPACGMTPAPPRSGRRAGGGQGVHVGPGAGLERPPTPYALSPPPVCVPGRTSGVGMKPRSPPPWFTLFNPWGRRRGRKRGPCG